MEQEQKKEFFNRKEIKTMSKDITRLREEEAKKERQRIAALKTEQEAGEKKQRQAQEQGPEREVPTQAPAERAPKKDLRLPTGRPWDWPPIPSGPTQKGTAPAGPGAGRAMGVIRPSIERGVRPKVCPSEKLLMRVSVALILILIFANIFLFWNWYIREQPGPVVVKSPPPIEEPGPEPPPTEPPPVEPPPGEPAVPPEPVIPPALISIQTSPTLTISALDELPELIKQALATELVRGQFTRVLILDKQENKILGLKEFWQEFSLNTPSDLDQKLKNDFTLFIYSQVQGNRLGYVAEIAQKQGLTQLLLGWEKTMESDLAKLFLLLGKKGPAISPYFRQAPYKGGVIRYQTFSLQDLGICYAIINDYFVFTTSWEGLLRTIDKLVED